MKDWNKISTTSSRLQEIMSNKGIKQAELARITGISRGAISNYVLGRYEPKSDIINKFATALNCSEMWLWGYDVPMEREEKSPQQIALSEHERVILNLLRRVPDDKREMVIQVIQTVLDAYK